MVLLVIFVILLLGWIYFRANVAHSIWKYKNVPHTTPSFLFGHHWNMFMKRQTVAEFAKDVYSAFPNKRYSGFYQFYKPILAIKDPDLLKQLVVKDFEHFTDHLSLIPDGTEPLMNQNLFSLKGDRWRDMRATLSPAFTSSKMKAMFTLMAECSKNFINNFLEKDQYTIELKDTFCRFGNDVIATCAFGVNCDSMRDKNNEFYLMGKKATNFSGTLNSLKLVSFLVVPTVSKYLGLRFFSKEVAIFFKSLITDAVKIREEKHIVRPDMIHLLMEARKGKLHYEEHQNLSKETGFATVEESDIGKSNKKKLEITDDDMCAQALIFFFAGFETVSTLMSFMGYELAINPDIQNKLRDEIDNILQESNGEVTYEVVNKMKYLDMVISESLRKWSSLPGVDRVCVKPYTLKATRPDECDVNIEVGEALWIPITGFHYDPKYFPNPEKFDPDRFSDENKHNIKPYTYMPFGVGPRNCIGSRFALLEAKILYINLLSKLELYVVEKTTIPMKLVKGFGNLTADGGIWIGLKPRK